MAAISPNQLHAGELPLIQRDYSVGPCNYSASS